MMCDAYLRRRDEMTVFSCWSSRGFLTSSAPINNVTRCISSCSGVAFDVPVVDIGIYDAKLKAPLDPQEVPLQLGAKRSEP